ncbi:MAG TPA: hypothetical protein VF543_22490 [Pyrinomonadaceae bacterium]|jgi:hypothetical protein
MGNRLKALLLLALCIIYMQLVMLATGATAQTISANGGTGTGMDATAIATVTIPVVAFTQIIKWAGLPDRRGPLVVVILSALGVIFWGWSTNTLSRVSAFSFFAGFTLVTTSAAGVFGFTRSLPEAVTSTNNPPAGAGANPTSKS